MVAEWGTYGGWHETREVSTAADALALCAEIESRAEVGRVLLGLTSANGYFFGVLLGYERSSVMCWESADPPYFLSRGTDSGDPLDYAYQGQHSEVPATSLIGRDAALRALAEFVATGERPESVGWDET